MQGYLFEAGASIGKRLIFYAGMTQFLPAAFSRKHFFLAFSEIFSKFLVKNLLETIYDRQEDKT
jgi:hypothetical protein